MNCDEQGGLPFTVFFFTFSARVLDKTVAYRIKLAGNFVKRTVLNVGN